MQVVSVDTGVAEQKVCRALTRCGAISMASVFSRYVARTEPLASMPPGQLTEHLTRTLRHVLLG